MENSTAVLDKRCGSTKHRGCGDEDLLGNTISSQQVCGIVKGLSLPIMGTVRIQPNPQISRLGSYKCSFFQKWQIVPFLRLTL